eukprot:362858-Chlamydomonas_euryale.AAC.6
MLAGASAAPMPLAGAPAATRAAWKGRMARAVTVVALGRRRADAACRVSGSNVSHLVGEVARPAEHVGDLVGLELRAWVERQDARIGGVGGVVGGAAGAWAALPQPLLLLLLRDAADNASGAVAAERCGTARDAGHAAAAAVAVLHRRARRDDAPRE